MFFAAALAAALAVCLGLALGRRAGGTCLFVLVRWFVCVLALFLFFLFVCCTGR